jgi:structural maintenance of chromosome 4
MKLLEIKLPKLQLEISGCDTTREELTKLIPELQIQSEVSEEDANKIVELKKNVQKCKSDMKACVKLASELEKEVSKMQRKILDAGGPRLKKQKAVCEKVVLNLNEKEKLLNSSRVEVKSTEKAESKAKLAREGHERDLDKCQFVLQEKQEEFKSLEEGAFEVMTAYEQVKKIEERKRSALERATKEAEDLKNSQSEARCVEIDLIGQLEAFEKQISENLKRKRRWEKEIARLQETEDENDIDDNEDEGIAEEPINEPDLEDGDAMDVDDDQQSDELDDGAKKESAENRSTLLAYSVLEKYDLSEVEQTIGTLQSERNMLSKNANMGAITEYRKKEADYLSRIAELDQVTEERNEARKEHEELRRLRLEMFMEGFGAITLKLKEMYQMITLGGDAELELVDSLDPFSEGIVFSVRPPKKSWKNISNLSGGEKTLSSLSLVFALHHYKPTPLYVMDEIDAALDFKNVSIVANYIKERTKNAQFIIISLRNNMFELADRLVGIYKTNNCTKSVTINPRAFGVAGHQNGITSTPAPLMDSTNMEKQPQDDDVTNTGKETRQGKLSVSTKDSPSPFFSLDNTGRTFFQSSSSA